MSVKLSSLPTDIPIPEKYKPFADEYIATRMRYFRPVKTGEQLICIHGAGIPSAGKSTKLRDYVREHPEWKSHHFTLIGNDDVMHSMPGYKKSFRKDGKEKSFEFFEKPARAINYQLLREAVKSRVHLLFDHSATAEYRLNLLPELREHGYYLEMVYVHCGIEEAIRRAKIRVEKTGQYVPLEYIPDRFEILQRLLPAYRGMVDTFVTLDNSAPEMS